MTYCLDIEAVIEINSHFVGEAILIDRLKLESALARPLQSAFGHDAHPTLAQKAAVLIHGVAHAHAFQDGNKRTSWSCGMSYLFTQGVHLRLEKPDVAGPFVLDLLLGNISIAEGAAWLLDRMDD